MDYSKVGRAWALPGNGFGRLPDQMVDRFGVGGEFAAWESEALVEVDAGAEGEDACGDAGEQPRQNPHGSGRTASARLTEHRQA
jgi:hypothetical protein